MKKIIMVLSFFIFTSANAGMSDKDKSKAWGLCWYLYG